MACTVYLIRAPRYEGISLEQIRLIESYLTWRRQCEKGSQYAAESFEKWCGHSIKKLPSKEVIGYFEACYNYPKIGCRDEVEGYEGYGLFEELVRFTKASQFLNWFMQNVLRTKAIPFDKTYALTRKQLEQLLDACNQVRRYGITYIRTMEHKNGYKETVFEVDEPIARVFLPIMENEGELMFPYEYGSGYAEQVVYAIKALNELLASTNFETQTIYFRYG